jgi:hypothetical protein
MTKDKQVFISHAHKDAQVAREIARALAEKGLKVFDPSRIRVGESIADAMEEALQQSEYFLLLVSPDYLSSPWTNFELGVALSREPDFRARHIFPVIVQEIDPKALPASLSDIAAISAREHSVEEIADRLTEAISRHEAEQVAEEV